MKICELILKNFGKFSDKSIQLHDGIQLIYGPNEAGKSTVHTFIKAMLFGMERGRGRASVNDTFSLYEPWENPNYYAGALRFESGGKHFVIQRHFDRTAKKVEVICEEDGEQLSVEDGDLEMVLDGLNMSGYDNTISVGQLKAQPGQTLASELKNYAINYYAAGDSDVDLAAALSHLEQRRKDAEKGLKQTARKKQEKRDRISQEASYVWRDVHKLSQEQERLDREIEYRKEKDAKKEQEELENKRVIDEIRPSKWRVHPLEIIGCILLTVASFALIPRPWNYLVTVVLALCAATYVWNRVKVGKKEEKTEPERILEEIMPEEEKLSLEKLLWERDHNKEELREKQVQYENIQEQLEELDETTEEEKMLYQPKAATELAVQVINELSAKLQGQLKEDLNKVASQIMEEITEGKYTKIAIDENLQMSLLHEGRMVPLEQVSRGTIEQLYFALRMAASELLHNEDYPVILDDTFAYYDDVRMERALKWLSKHKKQVLIFTCQTREKTALDKCKIPYHEERI